jgi:uncharacterized protein (DUF2237 family)
MSITNGNGHKPKPKNVLGGELKSCCTDPMTGFYRDGFCHTGANDVGSHIVCVEITDEFLDFSRSRGNDLITPHPEFGFPGLKKGDKWCLCAMRWREALEENVAPRIILEACHEDALNFVSLEDLKKYAITKV